MPRHHRPLYRRLISHLKTNLKDKTMPTAFRAAIALACVLAFTPNLFAQTRPVWQQKTDYLNNGPAGYSAHSAGTRLYDARQYTQQLYDYSQCAPAQQVMPAVTKVESEHIGQTIQAAKQSLAVVKKDAEATGNKAILKKLESIDKHLVSAAAHHKMMDMECCKEKVDGPATAKCCDELMTELDKALAEHASLIRLLGGSTPMTTPKPESTGTAAAPLK